MHQTACVCVGEPGCDILRDLLRGRVRKRLAVAEALFERPACEVLEHHVRPAVDVSVLEELDDVRVCEGRGGPSFAFEPLGVGVLSEQLHDDPSTQLDVRGEVHLAHRSAQVLVEAVAAGEDGFVHLSTLCIFDAGLTHS